MRRRWLRHGLSPPESPRERARDRFIRKIRVMEASLPEKRSPRRPLRTRCFAPRKAFKSLAKIV
jgi:hypothetical protein